MFDTTATAAADTNYAGEQVTEFQLNPLTLGERLRRLASNFECYSFKAVKVHYVAARPTITAGSLLGFFDQDPDDDFEEGLRSLLAAAAPPGAHSTKLWEDSTWTMPPRLGGRFYIGNSGDTAADRRLQDQGAFRLLVDVPMDSPPPEDQHFILGSLYVENIVHLTKPTIQPLFIGTSDCWKYQIQSAPVSIPAGANLVETYRASLGVPFKVVPTLTPESNAGSTFEPAAFSTGAGFAVSNGLWNVALSLTYTSTVPVELGIQGQYSSGLAPSSGVIHFGESTARNPNVVLTTTSVPIKTIANFRVFVPSAEWAYLTFTVSAALSINDLRVDVNIVLPTASEELALRPTSESLAVRLARLEQLASDPRPDEESKDPIVLVHEDTPRASGLAAPGFITRKR